MAPNSAMLSAECLRLYFAKGNAHDVPIIYVPHRGWFVYDLYWRQQGEEKLGLIQIPQTKFPRCVSDCLSLATRQNIFKQSRRGQAHPRRKFLHELEIALSNAKQLQELIREARLYFVHNGPMDSNPMLLQLSNATVDLETNTIRRSRPGDYLSKISTVSVPEYALEGSNTDEPDDARSNREWAYAFLWSIFAPTVGMEPHRYDYHHIVGRQDEENFTFFLQLIARLLEGRPLKRAVYFFSPRGRNSKRPIEIILSNLLGSYAAQCKHSIFTNDKRGGEANSAISLSRRGARVLLGQEIDRSNPWCNAVYKRRADCGKEGGTRKNSNYFEEYDPVYTICFGANVPPSFLRVPGNSEVDRCLIVYLPNRFCDEVDLFREPLSPRRFRKLDIEGTVARPEIAWAILDILLHLRRAEPDLDAKLSIGAPTSRLWREIWFPDAARLYRESRLREVEKGVVRLHECVDDFREWCESNLQSAFDYSRAPPDCVRGLLQRELGNATTRKKPTRC